MAIGVEATGLVGERHLGVVSDNGDVLSRVEADGSDMSRPMEIDFFVAVPSSQAGQIVASRAAELGFSATLECDRETNAWTCYCSMTLVPEVNTVSSLEKRLDELAREVGGHADGFGSR